MKCIACNTDSKFKDRTDGKCPKCKARFVFEPAGTRKDPVTDMLFKNAIDAVSSGGRIRWGVEHLYYEVCRRKRVSFKWPVLILVGFVSIWLPGFVGGIASAIAHRTLVWLIVFLAVLPSACAIYYYWSERRKPFPRLDRLAFGNLWDRWIEIRGQPAGLIVRQPLAAPAGSAFGRKPPPSAGIAGATPKQGLRPQSPSPSSMPAFGRRRTPPAALPGDLATMTTRLGRLEPDIGSYSFDRAVICDRARTVDLLVANNFHFENNCAVLSIDGYPEQAFDTVKSMLMRNPRLQIFVVHDATPDGCRLAHHLAYSPDWFDGKTRVIDLGLRPRHAGPFRGLWRTAAAGAIAVEPGIDAKEAAWLSNYELELAAVRPEYVLKRIYNGLTAHAKDDPNGGGVTNCGSFDGGGGDGGGHGGASDSGADGFG